MVLNYIWIAFFIIAFIVAIVKSFFGKVGDSKVWGEIVESMFGRAELGFELSIGLTGILALWLGIMKIGEKGGAIKALSYLVAPLFRSIFPSIPKNHPASGSIVMNFCANMLGLDNAATPLGLKAMDQLQELNPKKDTASNEQIMFLVLNTSGLTLIPVSIMALRGSAGSANPTDIFLPILFATFCSSLIGLITVSIIQKINLFKPIILGYILGAAAVIGGIAWHLHGQPNDYVSTFSSITSGSLIFGIIIAFISLALVKKVNIYESFVEGAKEGFNVAIKIVPFLIAMLVAIGAFTASGAMDYLVQGITWVIALTGMDTSFAEALPTAIMKPLSGGGARGMMVESWGEGAAQVDSFTGKLTSVLQGSTETTFYVLAVYFGSVGIKKTRYAIKAGLLADLGGIIAAIFFGYMFFGDSANQKPGEVVITEFVQEFNQGRLNENNFDVTDLTGSQSNSEEYFGSKIEFGGKFILDTVYFKEEGFFLETSYYDSNSFNLDTIQERYMFNIKNGEITEAEYFGNVKLEKMINQIKQNP